MKEMNKPREEKQQLHNEKTGSPLSDEEIQFYKYNIANGGIGNIPLEWQSKRNILALDSLMREEEKESWEIRFDEFCLKEYGKTPYPPLKQFISSELSRQRELEQKYYRIKLKDQKEFLINKIVAKIIKHCDTCSLLKKEIKSHHILAEIKEII